MPDSSPYSKRANGIIYHMKDTVKATIALIGAMVAFYLLILAVYAI